MGYGQRGKTATATANYLTIRLLQPYKNAKKLDGNGYNAIGVLLFKVILVFDVVLYMLYITQLLHLSDKK